MNQRTGPNSYQTFCNLCELSPVRNQHTYSEPKLNALCIVFLHAPLAKETKNQQQMCHGKVMARNEQLG